MSVEIKVPDLPESVSDAVVVAWHKQPGDKVRANEALLDLETDKVVLEIPAAEDGVLEKIIEEIDSVVVTGQVLGWFKPQALPRENILPASQKQPVENQNTLTPASGLLSPSARRLVQQKSLEIGELQGSGKGGRILKEDVLQLLEKKKVTPEIIPVSSTREKTTTVADPPDKNTEKARQKGREKFSALDVALPVQGYRMEKRVPMTRLRKKIAERLLDSQHNSAILTTFNEIDMQAIIRLRTRYQSDFSEKYQIKLGFMSFFVKAAVEALKEYPSVNAFIDGEDIVYHGYCDVGIAVSSKRGLVVPVLRNAELMSISDIEKAISHYAQQAKSNRLSLEDMQGGTFSISNGGVFGSMLSTPIINPPQSAILGMHSIIKKAVVVNDEIVIRPMMYLALSYDHRLIDGRDAVQFLVMIKKQLEDPARMLLVL